MKDAGTPIQYDHSADRGWKNDARAALPLIFPDGIPSTVLDVGCGIGSWLRAIAQAGATDYMGIDGVEIPAGELLVDRDHFAVVDLNAPWNLGRRFEALLCLEVAEHLPLKSAGVLIDALVLHSGLIVFSAACPGQPGQNHINGQWPSYWQTLFNERGHVCNDGIRWRLWDRPDIDTWYKQNMFIARHAPAEAGREPRLRPVVHPEMLKYVRAYAVVDHETGIREGRMSNGWYFRILIEAFLAKVRRKIAVLFSSSPESPP